MARGATGLPRPARQRPIVPLPAAAPASLGGPPSRKQRSPRLFARNHGVACDEKLPAGIALAQGERGEENRAGEQGHEFL